VIFIQPEPEQRFGFIGFDHAALARVQFGAGKVN